MSDNDFARFADGATTATIWLNGVQQNMQRQSVRFIEYRYQR
jgi:hypothetical protein